MSKFELDVWVTRPFLKTWTHVIKGSFVDPQSATQGATDLFCYDRNARIGAFFATVKNGRLDDGTLVQDGPRQVGANHTFSRRWTHIVHFPLPNILQPFPKPPKPGGTMLLFFDAASGVAEFYKTDGFGKLILKKRHTGLRTSWTLIVGGRFGDKASLLFYDATDGTGEFYSVDQSGNIHLEQRNTGWSKRWTSFIPGNFSDSKYDDLLFYAKTLGIGSFYRFDGDLGRKLLIKHTNWRKTWQHIVPGQFLQNAPFDGLLFYQEGSGHTEFYSTNGEGSISQIDIKLGNQWSLPWQAILVGEFTPNIGLVGTERLCAYDSSDGTLRYFFLELATIKTVIDLNGRWSDGSLRFTPISAAFTSLTIDMSAHHRPAAHGTIVDGSTIKVVFPDAATHTGKLQLPNKIRWSNGTSWTKA